MAELSVVRRYARALFTIARQQNQVDQVEADLSAVDGIVRQLPDLIRVLRDPTVSTPRKGELIDRVFKERVGPVTLRLLHLVVQRRRETVLRDILPEFRRLAYEYRNIMEVAVETAVPLTDQERDRLASSLAVRTGKQIQLKVSENPALLGGMVIRMGDNVLDGSVAGRIRSLRDTLGAGRVG